MTLDKKSRIMIPLILLLFGFILLLSAVFVLMPTFAYSIAPPLMGLILLYTGGVLFLVGVILIIIDVVIYKVKQKRKVSKF